MMVMRVVNVKELKARLSAYLREVDRGEEFLVTDRDRVVARLGPVALAPAAPAPDDFIARLVAIGARPPLRGPLPTDADRDATPSGLTGAEIDELLDWTREDKA